MGPDLSARSRNARRAQYSMCYVFTCLEPVAHSLRWMSHSWEFTTALTTIG